MFSATPPPPAPYVPPTQPTTLTGNVWKSWDGISIGSLSGYLNSATNIVTVKVSGLTIEENDRNPRAFVNSGDISDGSSFAGYFAGLSDDDTSGNWEGMVKDFYVTGSGFGFIHGGITGVYDGGAGTYSGDGDLTRTEIFGSSSIAPADLFSTLRSNSRSYDETGAVFSELVFYPDTISAESYDYEGSYSLLFQEGWGVWANVIDGTYSGEAPGGDWEATFQHRDATRIIGQEIAGTWSADNRITGHQLGYGADWGYFPVTWITIGDVLGRFEPGEFTFEAANAGVAVETGRFLTLAATADGQAKLQAMNIPAIQVGSATLTGNGTYFNVSMENVRFFARSTGGVPSVWATNQVLGSYSSNPLNDHATVSGGGLSAQFTIRSWNAGTWAATVDQGSGSLSGGGFTGEIEFRGAAAGSLSGSTFSGTAAGVAGVPRVE
jgi:hypothetical protein